MAAEGQGEPHTHVLHHTLSTIYPPRPHRTPAEEACVVADGALVDAVDAARVDGVIECALDVGFGRIVALYYCASTLYQIY